MPVAEIIISALIALGLSKGIDKLDSKNNPDGSVSLFADGKKVGSVAPEIGVVSPFEQLTTIATTNTKKQNSPDLKISNELDASQKIYGFSLTPDSGFKTKGHIVILINQRLFFETDDLNLSGLNFPIPVKGMEFFRGSDIEIFIWNEVDATSISVKVEIFTGI